MRSLCILVFETRLNLVAERLVVGIIAERSESGVLPSRMTGSLKTVGPKRLRP